MESFVTGRRIGAVIAVIGAWSVGGAQAAVGRTPGTATVSADGEAVYSIPLVAPPGINGLTPQLSLEYRHRTPGGLLGIGWSIGGLSQIAPCPRTVAQDGIAAPVSVSPDDRFCLDGQRLVAISGAAYGAPGMEYRTEIESFARIRSYAGPGLGPQYFVVEAADGRILEYGATTDSRFDGGANPPHYARLWALNRIRDRSGNVVDFSYFEGANGGDIRISAIRYNANPAAGIAPSHQLEFVYENRPNNEIDVTYVAGTPIRHITRLSRIDVTHAGSVIRRYQLGYQPALAMGGRSRLASVQECGQGGADCLAPTQFAWTDGSTVLGPQTVMPPGPLPGAFDSVRGRYTFADINGDGRSDIVWAGGTAWQSATVRFRLGLDGGGIGAEVDTGIAAPNTVGVPFDHNGDGRSDLLMADAAGRWQVLPGSASGFGTPIPTGIDPPTQLVDVRGADMNGDGLGDIAYSQIFAHTGNSLVVRVRYALPGGGFSASPVTLYEQATAMGYPTPEGGEFIGRPGERIDLDGDGAEDLLMHENYTIARISATRYATEFTDSWFAAFVPLDLNGDGCTDTVFRHYQGGLRARVGGCGIEWVGPDLQGPAWTGAAMLIATDWNGDGRDDVLLRGATNWQVALYRGDSFAPIVDTGIAHDGSSGAHARDFDGDGLDDLMNRVGDELRLRLRDGMKGDLLDTVTDGFGVTAAFTYRPLTDSTVYTRGTGAQYPEQDVQSSAHVVSQLATSDGSGTGAVATTHYRYEKLRRHLLGRGMLGFAGRTITDSAPSQALQIVESRHQSYPFTGLPKQVIARKAKGDVLREDFFVWDSLELGTGAARRQFPHVTETVSRSYELAGIHAGNTVATTSRTVAAVDPASGLVTDETTTITEVASGMSAGASASRRLLHTSVLNDNGNWCLGRPQATQVTASHALASGSPITRSFSQIWDAPLCRPTLRRSEPENSQLQVTEVLAYDGFGNLASRRLTGAGMSARTTTVGWDERGRFPIHSANPLSQVTTISWDAATGLPLATTDPNALAVSWSYDALGRLIGESRPDGTGTRWSYSACDAGCDARTRMQITQQEQDSSGVTRATMTHDVDQHGRVVREASQQPGGADSVSVIEYDGRGRPTREHLPYWSGGSPPGHRQYEYDALDRLVHASLRAANGVTERSLDLRHDGLAISATDALGHSRVLVRSAWGDTVSVTDAAGGRTSYEYDAFGRPVKTRDAAGAVVASQAYNLRGMLISQTDTDMGTWTYSPNALGETISVRDANGQLINYAYDKLGRLTSRAAPDGTANWTWGSTASKRNIGRLAGVSAPGYGESYAYDAFGRPTTHTISADASYRYDYAYNSLGLLDTLTYPDTGVGGRFRIGFEYDAGQLVRIRNANEPASSFWRLNSRDAAGHVIEETLASGVRVVTGVSPTTGVPEYRLAGVGGGNAIQNLAWDWDAAGNLVRRQDLNRGLTEDFRYDVLDRLDDSRRNGAINLDLEYDAADNILWKSDVCPTTAPCFEYHPTRRHVLTAAGGMAYGYDANGNMTSRGGASVAWTSANELRAISQANGNSSQFWYGPAGNRWKQVAVQGGATETTIYAGGLMEKVTKSGVTRWRHYVVAPTGTAAVYLRSSAAPAASRYLTHDHLGSTAELLDAAGTVLVHESFDAFGRRRGADWISVPTAQELAAIAAVTRDGFTGHEHLDHLDLIHMEGRVYDPRLGRFLSADPIVPLEFDGQSLNRYAYVWNNPLSFVDPSGFVPCVESNPGVCARVTLIGRRWYPRIYAGGAGYGQVVSAKERDPCGRDSDGMACATQHAEIHAPINVVFTAGVDTDSTMARSPTTEFLQGAAARAGNLLIDAAPITWLFGTSAGFDWFEVPGTPAGRAGSYVGNAGVFVGGFGGAIRQGIGSGVKGSASASARSLQGNWKYPGVDRFRDIMLKRGTLLFRGYPDPGHFYTTASAIRRSGGSASYLYDGLQLAKSKNHTMRTSMAIFEVLEDTPAAFGLAIRNFELGTGWLPQVVVPSFETSLRFLGTFPLRP